jgi:hypothetical protein
VRGSRPAALFAFAGVIGFGASRLVGDGRGLVGNLVGVVAAGVVLLLFWTGLRAYRPARKQ